MVLFASFEVGKQGEPTESKQQRADACIVFFTSRLSVGIVNLKPLLPGRELFTLHTICYQANHQMSYFCPVESYLACPT